MIDYKELFRQMPNYYCLVGVDLPKFTIIDMCEKALLLSNLNREKTIGAGLFEVFPDNPAANYSYANGVRDSILIVLETRKQHIMATMQYDIEMQPGKFETRYWQVTNYPFIIKDNIECVIVYSLDLTPVFSKTNLYMTDAKQIKLSQG